MKCLSLVLLRLNIEQTCIGKYLKHFIEFVTQVVVLLCATNLFAADFYVSAENGKDSNCGSLILPWASFKHAMSSLTPGDSLIILDGIYYQSLEVVISGTEKKPITIKAQNDGKVIIDGQGKRVPAEFGKWNTKKNGYVIVKGIVFQNSSGSVVRVNSHHNIFRRCSAYYGKLKGKDHCWALVKTQHTLLEDCVGAATERHIFTSWTDDGRETHNIFRRCFSAGTIPGKSDTSTVSEFNCYGGSYDVFENCIGWGGTEAYSVSVHSQKKANYKCRGNKILGGIFLRAGDTPHVRQYSGVGLSVSHGGGENPINTYVENCIFYGHNIGVNIGEEGECYNTVLNHCSIMNNQKFGIRSLTEETIFKNSLLYKNQYAFSSKHNKGVFLNINIYGNTMRRKIPARWLKCSIENPGIAGTGLAIPRNSSCKGAGEGGGDIGANISCRYERGVLTKKPLWPWPMQKRILDELGIDVMAELSVIFGNIIVNNEVQQKNLGDKK